MWRIFEDREAQRGISKAPLQVAKKYEFWKSIVSTEGPNALRALKGFHDEALKGSWEGNRSSRLNLQYRVVYRVIAREVLVVVERVSPHDYR